MNLQRNILKSTNPGPEHIAVENAADYLEDYQENYQEGIHSPVKQTTRLYTVNYNVLKLLEY